MELNHLRYFFEVARQQSFTQAARVLRVSQPSISKQVRLLEDHEGVRLLDRSRRGGVVLTPMGRIFYERCERIFGEIENLKAAASSKEGECVGDLALGASDNLCNYIVPQFLPGFLKRNPKLRFRLFAGTAEGIQRELLADRAEMGFFYTPIRDLQFSSREIARVEMVVVAKQRVTTRKELAELPCVGSRQADYSGAYIANDILKAHGIKPMARLEINNHETQKRLVLKGMGYMVIPRFAVSEDLVAGRLNLVRPSQATSVPLFQVQRKSRTPSRAAGLFTDAIVATLKKSTQV